MQSGQGSLTIYRGSPQEIVRAMASEMGDGVTIRQAVKKLTSALSNDRRITIQFPDGVPEEQLAKMFVHALLVTKLGREMPQA
jgi:hypothetical protein